MRSSRWNKLRLYQVLLWGGAAVFATGMLSAGRGWTPGIALLILGLAASMFAVFRMDRHYRCPRCGASLAGAGGSRMDAALGRLPYYCPQCGWEVDEGQFR